jgi:type II secretory pathway component PulJ
MKTARKISSEGGLTLIELVVVAVLTAILSALLYGTLSGVIRARETTETSRSADETAHYVLARMSVELAGRSFVPLNVTQEQSLTQAQTGNPYSSTGGQTYMFGIDEQNGDTDRDSLRFVSANAAQPFVGAQSNHGLVEVEYHLAENNEGSFSDTDGRRPLTLIREEIPAAVNSDEIIKARRITVPLADNVVSLNFRYLKNGTWQNDWKETSPPLPEAVEITLKLKSSGEQPAVYRTAIPISARLKSARPAS